MSSNFGRSNYCGRLRERQLGGSRWRQTPRTGHRECPHGSSYDISTGGPKAARAFTMGRFERQLGADLAQVLRSLAIEVQFD